MGSTLPSGSMTVPPAARRQDSPAASTRFGSASTRMMLSSPVSFRRRIDEMDLLEPIEGERTGGAHRPAQLWRLKDRRRGALTLTDRLLGPAVLAP